MLNKLRNLINDGEGLAAELIGRNPKTARRLLLKMIKEGIISATGANRNRKYKMVKNKTKS